MLDARVVSQAIDRNWRELYDAFWRPEAFPLWASGLSDTSLTMQGDDWTAVGPGGPVTIRFSPCNDYGVMDHWVEIDGGQVVYVPLRIVANGPGALVQLTLFRQPGMSDDEYARDAALVSRDLACLKTLAEAG